MPGTNKLTNNVYLANKSLGYIRRNTRSIQYTSVRRTIYLALIRSHFGFPTQVWAPQSIDLIVKLERTQRRARKYILNLPFTCAVKYSSRLLSLSLLPICYWYEYLDMVHYFKVTRGLINSSYLPLKNNTRYTRSSSSNTSTPKYVVPRCKTTTHQRSFWMRSIRTWNTLADKLDFSMISLNLFKSVMFNYYFTALEKMYD